MTKTTPELAPPSPNFHATPTGGRLATTYDLAFMRPHTRRIFSGIGFLTCNPPPQSTDLTTRPPRPGYKREKKFWKTVSLGYWCMSGAELRSNILTQ
ncbi:hypothetical protein AVEN_136484-1 [Araneus ventricosus]|uniref:Uncharacterized protein n=1 Tax=Araneus ventricosus TaxID=182803 RepID=A0A4Y2UPM3_ARAVE|nr:hypothetical protein AVEN_136484-1 [Araneus ventricosus]